ncbi:helix-turn-helix transcriptional regulator [Paenibacillus nicotianae]|uniref:Helix-turn-helix transcriptional regulator n=1 Tax=Paenibacillus nicotianae TaxID=1526551 RepID=A0ABW4USD4_9BACL
MNIHTMSYESIIVPGGIVHMNSNCENKLFFIATHSELILQVLTEKIVLQPNDIVIGNNLVLENISSNDISFCSISFETDDDCTPCSYYKLQKCNPNYTLCLSNIFSAFNNHKLNDRDVLVKSLEILLNKLKNDMQQDLFFQIDQRILLVNKFIENNYFMEISLQSLSELVGYNPVYLSNKYSSVLNISPMRHLQKIRMENALLLLKNTDNNISDIATAIGYLTASQFSAIFKKFYNFTPSQFRSTCKIKIEDSHFATTD